MMTRRMVLACAGAMTVWSGADAARMTGTGPADFDETHDLPRFQGFGADPALRQEEQLAVLLMDRAPGAATGALPIDVFNYFAALTERNADGEAYNGGWRVRWNPVIRRFFEQTNTRPKGDETAWCAASMNWVLDRCGMKGTHDAGSQSFVGHAGRTTSPRPGDIVVFTEAVDPAHGHVALFLDRSAQQIECLGGNQYRSTNHHAVCRQTIRADGRLKLNSFYTIEAFRT